MGLISEACELYPDIIISYALFDNVRNCVELKEKSKSEEIKVALINPKMVSILLCRRIEIVRNLFSDISTVIWEIIKGHYSILVDFGQTPVFGCS